ncbi:MAG: SDR family NAD(P)-dependent oxidoreductase, partial [Pseudohongiella sp.]|nr:SDR family NAD(P)-dependent oxidoreductase [Pseudohongiella sp.]
MAGQVQAAGGQAHCVTCDVTEQTQCENLVEEAVKTFGGIDMIVNNAGVSMHAWFEDISDLGTFERLFRVNVMSMV